MTCRVHAAIRSSGEVDGCDLDSGPLRDHGETDAGLACSEPACYSFAAVEAAAAAAWGRSIDSYTQYPA